LFNDDEFNEILEKNAEKSEIIRAFNSELEDLDYFLFS
jgi:hypothetical protein